MITSPFEKRARALAKRHGYTIRRIPHSIANPNGYVRVTTPDGKEIRATDYVAAVDTILLDNYRRSKR